MTLELPSLVDLNERSEQEQHCILFYYYLLLTFSKQLKDISSKQLQIAVCTVHTSNVQFLYVGSRNIWYNVKYFN